MTNSDFDDLDGHTLEELSDYLESGRTPRDPGIENSAACRLALEGLARLRALSLDALQREADRDPTRDDGWIAGLLDIIKDEIRPGRDIPISDPDAMTSLSVTEAAVRGLVRAAADALPSVIIGRTEIEGDVSTPGAPVRVRITAAAEYGHALPPLVEELRRVVAEALAEHTELVIDQIDVTIDDVYRRAER
ncbi:hypothetical protein N1028_03855 [Herbiconiux sp. CPCC 203407]|uniref:Asp23/Gls24 family envelope stress response protein n=1 Tax=Herbiconiux oxytropis TaxID=2970915 RepID=A0AA41XF35_9MICO|nr:hypothetical protein [Herbiconiux oxytropis]MCS5720649.1 hypothetical protein [Herbiconiux oxytropis]MCS5725024.1 hypothetical protein [Herbiconiux oxytropis]